MEIIPGVHRVENVRGANCYLVITGAAFFIIDTGMPGNAKKIADYMVKLGKNPGDLAYIILTHADIDHSGSAAALKALTGASVAIHAGDAAVLAHELGMKRPPWLLPPVFSLIAKIMKFEPVKPDIALKEGDAIAGYTVVHCPGHTDGSMALYQAGGIIFVGDALRSDAGGHPRLPSGLLSLNYARALDSVKKISKLEFEVMFPGHGAPVVKEASRRVRELLSPAGI